MLATFAASPDKPDALTFVGTLGVASGDPIGETDGVCGGGSAAPAALGSPAPLAPAFVGTGVLGTFGSGSAPLGLPDAAALGVRVLGALGGALGAPATRDAGLPEAAFGLTLGALGALLDAPAP